MQSQVQLPSFQTVCNQLQQEHHLACMRAYRLRTLPLPPSSQRIPYPPISQQTAKAIRDPFARQSHEAIRDWHRTISAVGNPPDPGPTAHLGPRRQIRPVLGTVPMAAIRAEMKRRQIHPYMRGHMVQFVERQLMEAPYIAMASAQAGPLPQAPWLRSVALPPPPPSTVRMPLPAHVVGNSATGGRPAATALSLTQLLKIKAKQVAPAAIAEWVSRSHTLMAFLLKCFQDDTSDITFLSDRVLPPESVRYTCPHPLCEGRATFTAKEPRKYEEHVRAHYPLAFFCPICEEQFSGLHLLSRHYGKCAVDKKRACEHIDEKHARGELNDRYFIPRAKIQAMSRRIRKTHCNLYYLGAMDDFVRQIKMDNIHFLIISGRRFEGPVEDLEDDEDDDEGEEAGSST